MEIINLRKYKNLPIGIFDSGIGGLTTVHKMNQILPDENIIYFGDTGRVPYGTKSRETIIKYAKQDINFLRSLNVKMIIAACGTVSSVAIDVLSLPVVFTGVVKPTAVAAASVTENGRIGVIGTNATIKSSAYFCELKKINKNFVVIEKACPLFVSLVENGMTSENDFVVLEIIKRYLSEFEKKNVDTLILGCTHYPMLKNAIIKAIGKKIKLVDSGEETAFFAAKILERKNMLKDDRKLGECSFYVSDEVSSFKDEAQRFLKWEKDYLIKKINIEKYNILI